MTPTCPTCRADLHTVGHYALDGSPMETYLLCLHCGYEDKVADAPMPCAHCGYTNEPRVYECARCGWELGFSTHSEDTEPIDPMSMDRE